MTGALLADIGGTNARFALATSDPSAPALLPDSVQVYAVADFPSLADAARHYLDKVGAAPMPGFREALVQGQVVYVSDDGRYLFLPGSGGALFDTQAKRNLMEDTLAGMRRDLLKTIPASERIVFAPANPKHTVTVFTDVECGYCLLYTSPSPRDVEESRMPSSA